MATKYVTNEVLCSKKDPWDPFVSIPILGVVSTVSVPLVVVVATGLVAAIGLNYLDDKFGVTDKVVAYIEHSQQEFVETTRQIEQGLWDLGAMYADQMLDKGREVFVYEVKKYIRDSLKNLKPGVF